MLRKFFCAAMSFSCHTEGNLNAVHWMLCMLSSTEKRSSNTRYFRDFSVLSVKRLKRTSELCPCVYMSVHAHKHMDIRRLSYPLPIPWCLIGHCTFVYVLLKEFYVFILLRKNLPIVHIKPSLKYFCFLLWKS